VIPYEQLVEALARWQAERRAAEAGETLPSEPTDGEPGSSDVAEAGSAAELTDEADVAEVADEADMAEVAEELEPEPE